MSNHLANETSPYLLQHADNPVEWYPWGELALRRARAEQKPIFLSIGYAACHWCHVMAHESFEDAETAAILNEHFVNIKVDREERPDLDRIYMAAVQAMTGGGGWPMSVFLTAEGEPFHAGTYYPPEPRYGMPSFRDVLLAVIEAWEGRREQVRSSGARIVEALERAYREAPAHPGRRGLSHESLASAQSRLTSQYDHVNGGWGGAPKFPQAMAIEFLLRRHVATDRASALAVAEDTLVAMSRGGMYDQIGGGFHRYSVDEKWLVPHFEKMLYDNAQLARVYVHAWQLTGRPLFRAIAEETLDFVLREMTDPAGGFYASLDADSEGEEGRYYTWTMEELKETLGDDAAEFIKRYAPRHEEGLHGRAVLAYVGDEADRPESRALCERLFRARQRRERPARDDKVLASWNGLMLAALADAGRAFARDDYTRAARRSAAFLLEALRTPEGRLLRVWKAGVARLNGYLEDYAHLVEGLLALYQATFETHWFRAARDLAEQILTHFGSDTLLYDTSDDHEELVVRPRELEDNATPSGNAMAATVLLQLADLTLEARYGELAHRMLAQAESLASGHPLAFAQWLIAADFALSPHLTLAIVGDPADERTASLLEVWEEGYHPHGVVAVGGASSTEEDVVPLLAGRRQADGRPTAYLCGQASCQTPTTEPSVLRELIAAGRGRQLAAH